MKPTPVIATASLLAGAACAAPASSESVRAEQVYRHCIACHALEPGHNTPAGPTLDGIVGRQIAAEPGFNYSPALRRLGASKGRWTPELLDRFLADPVVAVPGTEMGYAGLSDAADRRVLIAWLEAGQPRGR